jgi:hypothetical protein
MTRRPRSDPAEFWLMIVFAFISAALTVNALMQAGVL